MNYPSIREQAAPFNPEQPTGIVVTIHEVPGNYWGASTVMTALSQLGASQIYVDTGGVGKTVLDRLQQEGLPAIPLPKQATSLAIRLANARALLARTQERLTRLKADASVPFDDLLFDFEALKERC